MTSDGSPWRPLVHVDDICRAIRCTLEAPRSSVHNQIFNVGSTQENYQIREIAEIVGNVFSRCSLSIGTSNEDNRSYRVNFEKIREHLPGFSCQHTLKDGARQLKSLFEKVTMDRETFEFRAFTRLEQLKYLIESEQIDDAFFWTEESSDSEVAETRPAQEVAS